MHNNEKIIKNFCNRWGREIVKNDDINFSIESVEQNLKLKLPESFKFLYNKYSDLYFPKLLDYISDKELEMYDVQEFIPSNKILNITENYIKAGMPDGFLGFAMDCMGNMFCFKIIELKQNNDSKIYLFDHDYVKIFEISSNFISWIDSYNQI